MEYISIDIEVSGLNSEQDSLLEFAAILEDTNNLKSFDEIPKFQTYIINDKIIGNPFALNMNKGIIEKLANYPKNEKEYNFTNYENLSEKFYNWLIELEYIESAKTNFDQYQEFFVYNHLLPGSDYPKIKLLVAGKNFANFDYQFLKKVPKFLDYFEIHHRILDPVTLYTDWKHDIEPPNTDICNQRAEIKNEYPHNALYDCWNCIKLFRKKY